MSFLASSYDYWMEAWMSRVQIWPLITMRTWPKEDSLHFHPGLFTSFLRKDSESTHFLPEHLVCSNQHPEDRKFHHSLHMCIICVTRNFWLGLWRSKCLFLIKGINRIYVGLHSGPRNRHAQRQFMVITQNCELKNFYSLSLNWSMAEFPKHFWQIAPMLQFFSKEGN